MQANSLNAAPAASSAPASRPRFPHFHIKFEGRPYKLFKEQPGQDAPYYIRLWRDGAAVKRSLGTNVQATAELRARPIIAMHRAGVPLDLGNAWLAKGGDLRRLLGLAATGAWDEVRAFAGDCGTAGSVAASLKDLFEAWEVLPLDIGEKHRRNVPLAVRRVLRLAGWDGTESASPEEVWSEALPARWKAGVMARVKGAPEQDEQKRLKYSANRDLQVALCFWKPNVIAAFKEKGLVVPEVQYFERVVLAFKGQKFRKVGRPPYNAPRDEVVAETLAQWRKRGEVRGVRGEPTRNEFIAIGLMLAFGLRKGEVAQARGGWLTSIEGQPFLDSSKVSVKSGSGIIQARALDPFYSQLVEGMKANGWGVKADEFLIEGTNTERCEGVFNRISAWMRSLGWETVKTNHVMRDYAGSQVCMRYGLEKASTWLRHSSLKVTQEHYTDFVKRHAMEAELVPVHWASLQTVDAPAPSGVALLKTGTED